MSYIGNVPVLQTTEFREEFEITTNTTTITTLGFNPTAVEVFRNGVLLAKDDYTLGVNGVSITLATVAIPGDTIVVTGRRSVAQGVSISESRVEYTWQVNDTFVQLNADVIPAYTDVYVNGVKLASDDYSINAGLKQVSFTVAPAIGDIIAVIHKNETSSLVALPITDSAGNNVLSESGGVVTVDADNYIIDNAGKISSVGQIELQIDTDNNQSGTYIGFSRNNTTSERLALFQENGDISFYEDTGTTPKLFWDASAESLGIGTESPSAELEIRKDNATIYINGGGSAYELRSTLKFTRAKILTAIQDQTAYGDTRMEFHTQSAGTEEERMRIDSSGNVGIGTESPSYKLDITGPGTAGASTLRLNDAASVADSKHLLLTRGSTTAYVGIAGSQVNDPLIISRSGNYDLRIESSGDVKITNLGTGTVYSNSGVLTNTDPSDLNLKENVVEISYGLSEVKQLRPVEFDWIADEADKHELGFIAQEVQLIIPDLVNTYERIINEETGETEIGYGLESTQFIPVLVKAIQEQQTIIESQQSQIDALTARIEALETQPN